MLTISVETVIAQPVGRVFAFVADRENDPRWCVGVRSSERMEGDGPGPGTIYRMEHAPGGKVFEATVRTLRYEPERYIESHLIDPEHDIRITYEFNPVIGQERTRLRQTNVLRMPALQRLPGALMARAIEKVLAQEMQSQFDHLRNLLEATFK